MQADFWDFVRANIIGWNAVIETPFGRRRVTYADDTASGRGLRFVERYLERVQEHYANTHTEDDATGRITTARLEQAERTIKKLLHASEEYKIIEDGTGATGAVHRLQQILGVYIPPVAKDFFRHLLDGFARVGGSERREAVRELEAYARRHRPLVFVGPYEHHSNEVSWRECFAEVVEIDLNPDGLIDLKDLENKLERSEYRGRRKIGAFSAASNVSGLITPVYDVARILHSHDALAFFDFAAIAPYGEIDLCRDEECFFDGIYFSPHKFLGGPGSSGILVIHQRIYREDLPPTVGAGGTVNYVSFDEQSYDTDIEVREKPGTPGILQTMKASLSLQLKDRLGTARIAQREKTLIRRALRRFRTCDPIEIIGNLDPERRIAILSFNIRAGSSYLHPRFITLLLNDLFGIQSRAGCSCAGPYGHRVLHIDEAQSERFRVRLLDGYCGLKPGWVRVNFHYLMTDEEFEFILKAICFICRYGRFFLPLYKFEIHSGDWCHRDFRSPPVSFGLDDALAPERLCGDSGEGTPAAVSLQTLFDAYWREAMAEARRLSVCFEEKSLKTTEKDLIPFIYVD